MGMLIHGKWYYADFKPRTDKGEFKREASQFRNWIKNDPEAEFPAEQSRYHLYISLACPWACRAYIMYKLKKLKDVIGLSIVDPYMGPDGWHFSDNPGCIPDTVNHTHFLRELYIKADHQYTGRVTVPVLWDKKKHTIVNNESSDIMRMLNHVFDDFTDVEDDYYPKELQPKIDTINEKVQTYVNNGVYKCGFATRQTSYEKAFDALFETLDELEELLGRKRYLAGNQITESDWRLFTTLVRFDAVYHYHFKCNRNRIYDYPNLENYLRELYQYPGIKETVDFDHIKTHYYCSHPNINPMGIIPKGPRLSLEAEHNRQSLEVA